uniref:GP-PDE domain-containing protein n=1 Tax=Panagrellus redivivus TaxID=6233 RepID=A0A7E4VZY8_PANRE
MGPDICPEVLLSKMDGQYYTDLYLTGKYDWKNVVAFLHAGVKCVKMNDYMSLPAENMKEFFDTLFRFKVKFVWIVTDNYEESWLFSAQKTFNDAGITAEYVSYKERYCPEVIVTSGNEKIRIIGNTFVDGPEFMPDSDDSDYEEEYDEFEYDEFY